jgi:hypothetical protein
MRAARQGLTPFKTPSEPGFEPGFLLAQARMVGGIEKLRQIMVCYGQLEKMGENEMRSWARKESKTAPING